MIIDISGKAIFIKRDISRKEKLFKALFAGGTFLIRFLTLKFL